jgi:hypothetical protein
MREAPLYMAMPTVDDHVPKLRILGSKVDNVGSKVDMMLFRAGMFRSMFYRSYVDEAKTEGSSPLIFI